MTLLSLRVNSTQVKGYFIFALDESTMSHEFSNLDFKHLMLYVTIGIVIAKHYLILFIFFIIIIVLMVIQQNQALQCEHFMFFQYSHYLKGDLLVRVTVQDLEKLENVNCL